MVSRTILIVEDDTDSQSVVSWAVQSRGHISLVASSLAEAEQKLRDSEHPISGLVLDFHLPDGDGMQWGIQLKKRLGIPIPLIGITAYYTPELRAQALAIGFDACFTKPLPMDDFIAALGKLIR